MAKENQQVAKVHILRETFVDWAEIDLSYRDASNGENCG
jgi:hypothetical protein